MAATQYSVDVLNVSGVSLSMQASSHFTPFGWLCHIRSSDHPVLTRVAYDCTVSSCCSLTFISGGYMHFCPVS